jgi:SAM-dependent methyltransferase
MTPVVTGVGRTSGQPARPRIAGVGTQGDEDPFESHRQQVAAVLPTGDTQAIKSLYVALGADLEAAAADDLGSVPLLSFPETAAVVSTLLGGVEGTLLDAGCGPQPALSLLLGSSPGRHVVAVDIGEGMVRLARAVAAGRGVRLSPVVGDLESLPFRAGAFAGIACDDTIEHVPDDRAAVGELARVLAPAGRLVLATPNRVSAQVLVRRTRDALRRRRLPASAYYAATSHLREYSWRDLERLVAGAFHVRERASVPWSGGRKHRMATWITGYPGARRLGRMVVVALEKRRP